MIPSRLICQKDGGVAYNSSGNSYPLFLAAAELIRSPLGVMGWQLHPRKQLFHGLVDLDYAQPTGNRWLSLADVRGILEKYNRLAK